MDDFNEVGDCGVCRLAGFYSVYIYTRFGRSRGAGRLFQDFCLSLRDQSNLQKKHPALRKITRSERPPIMSQDGQSTSAIVRAPRVLLSMDAEDVLEAGAEPEGLGSAEGSTDGVQLVRYVNPAQCVPTSNERLPLRRGVLIL